MHKISKDEKKRINKGAVKAATVDTMPLSIYYQKPDFLITERSLIAIGQRHPVSAGLDVKDALSCCNAIRNTISGTGLSLRQQIKEYRIPKMI